MSLVAGTILNHARDMHPSLAPMHTPEPLAWRQITRQQEKLVQDITRVVPAQFAEQVGLPFPPTPAFTDGWNLATFVPQGYKDLLTIDVVWSGSPNRRPTRATFAPFEQTDLHQQFPAVTFRNGVLYPLGGESHWQGVSSLTLTYTALPAAVTSATSVLMLPDDALDCMAAMLAAFFAQRIIDVPQAAVSPQAASMLAMNAVNERSEFLSRIRQVAQKQRYRIRDVMGYNYR